MTMMDPTPLDIREVPGGRAGQNAPEPLPTAEEQDFSLILGGPIFQLLRRSHLSGDGLELLERRVLFITGLAWLPLLILSMVSGHLTSGTPLPFLRDVEAHARLLVALP